MKLVCITAAAIIGAASATSNSSIARSYRNGTNSLTSSGILPCDALAEAGLSNRLLYAGDDAYEPQIATWWALNSRQHPYCILLPETVQEVALAVIVLGSDINRGAGDWHVAVKSGGHASTEINNIDQGITIDLSYLNDTSYKPLSNIASIQSGGRWRDVYAELQKYNVVVAGGRDGGVGVGGFLLGGGISFFQAAIGYSCDTIINYEIVLADGSIVDANKTYNPDLFIALKGGSSNFGIVTRFDLTSIPSYEMDYTVKFLTSDFSDILIDTIVAFANQGPDLTDDALIAFYTYNSTLLPDIYMVAVHVNTKGTENGNFTSAFSKLDSIPALSTTSLKQTMSSAAINSQVPGDTWNSGATLTFKNDADTIREITGYHNDLVNTLKTTIGSDTFTTLLFFEPTPAFTGDISKAAGGNMLGLQDVRENYIIYVFGVAVNGTVAQAAIAQREIGIMTARVKKLTQEKNTALKFVYMNYADASQDPIGSYGNSNIQHLRNVAQQYDPKGVFQTKFSQGFKISRVGTIE